MKYLFPFFALVFFLPAFAAAQTAINTTKYKSGGLHKVVYTQGRDTSLVETYYENGNLEKQIWTSSSDSKSRIDSIKYYYTNGQLGAMIEHPSDAMKGIFALISHIDMLNSFVVYNHSGW
jgi:hypothetical protein